MMEKPEDIKQSVVPEKNQAEADQVESELVDKQQVDLGPAQQAQLEAYCDNATLIVYSEDKQNDILHGLQKSGKDNVKSLAETAYGIHKGLEASLAKQGESMTEITLALGAAHLVSELVVLADAAGLYDLEPVERLEAYKHAVMLYFKRGVEDGSIDVAKLQETIEPLMTDEQRAAGLAVAEQHGLSKTPPPSQMARPAPKQQQQGTGIIGRAS